MTTIQDLLTSAEDIYGKSNDRLYDLSDLFYYHQKWLLRYTESRKFSRRKDAIKRIAISIAWYFAIINRFHIDLTGILERRYSYKCPYCLEMPCNCQTNQLVKRSKKTGRPASRIPQSVDEWQQLILKIYPIPAEFRNLEILRHQDILYQKFRQFRRLSAKRNFHQLEVRATDYFVELLKVSNNLEISLAEEYVRLFGSGCSVCHKSPCECFYVE